MFAAADTDTTAVTGVFAQAIEEMQFAYENVPFYGGHLDAAGIDPSRVRTPSDFRRVPVTRKQHYREHFPAGVIARGRSIKDPQVELTRSSGRTGERLTTARWAPNRLQRHATTLSVHPMAFARGNNRRDHIVVYGPPACSDVDCANPLLGMLERTIPSFPAMLALSVAHDMLMTPARMVEQTIREIREWAPTTIIAAGSHASFLIREYIKRDLSPPPFRFCFATFTQVTELSRAHWRAFFGKVPFVNVYNMTEFGSIAAECPAGRMHLNQETYYLEVIRPDGEPAGVGELGELYITSIGDRFSPHVRYATGDYFRPLDGCTCGSPWPTVTLEGRKLEFLRDAAGQPVTPGQVSRAVGAPDGVDVYQVVQDVHGHVRAGLRVNDDYRPATADDLTDRLRALLGDVPVRVEPATYLPCEKSGKFLYCRSETQ